jgi:hypothetical protein
MYNTWNVALTEERKEDKKIRSREELFLHDFPIKKQKHEIICDLKAGSPFNPLLRIVPSQF